MGFHWALAIIAFQRQLWAFIGNHGFSMAIVGFHRQSWVLNGDHKFGVVLVHSWTFNTFFSL